LNRFWKKTILPIIEKTTRKHIVEIGCYTGVNTENIIKYCIKNDAKLSAIDPYPLFPVEEWKELYKDHFYFYEDLSLNALPNIKDYDIVLIDGDHNWYTVYNELNLIEENNNSFPIILLHDVSWPYARRDLYYNPENIPEEYRHPYGTDGMIPGQSELVAGGFNCTLNNALTEGGEKNGVLTAVEDFLDKSELNLNFNLIEKFNGLGIIYPNRKELNKKIESCLE